MMIRRCTIGLILLLLTACGSAQAGPTATPANTLAITVAYARSLQPWLEPAIQNFNASGAKIADGSVISVTGQAIDSGAMIENMVQGNSPYDLVIPADKVWLDLLANRRADRKQPALTIGTCTDVARSPVVMAVWRPMADALGWPERQFTWNDISQLALSPSAWQGYDHPEWGTLTFGHAHPVLSDGGLAAILGEAYAAAPLTTSDVQSDSAKSYVRVVERSVARYGSDSSSLIQTMAQKGQRYLNIAIGYEVDVISNHQGDDGLVAIYPTETFVADFTACPVSNTAADTAFIQFLTSDETQKAALAAGLRPVGNGISLGAPIDAAHGADVKAAFKELPMPDADVIQVVQDTWGQLKRPLNVTLVIDVSGSMKDNNKIEGARDGAQAFVKRLSDSDTLNLYSFSDSFNLLMSQAKLGDKRSQILDAISGLQADGGTALYDTIDTARKSIKTSSDRINAIVVLTDGQDTQSSTSTLDSLIQDINSAKGNVILYTIGYGGDADGKVLSQIADAGNGAYFSGDPGNINQVYLEIATQVGGSRGLGR